MKDERAEVEHAARGCMLGIVVGAIMWAGLIALWVLA